MSRSKKLAKRWVPIFEYLLSEDLPTIFILMGVTAVGWYSLTDFLWQVVFFEHHEELDYLFLLCPCIALVTRGSLVRGAIDSAQAAADKPLPLPDHPFAPDILADMCDALVITNKRARGFYRWMGSMLRKTDTPVLLADLPNAWRRRKAYWIGLTLRASIPLVFALFLASPWQFYLGDALAQGLDSLSHTTDHVEEGWICLLRDDGSRVKLDKEIWPGDAVSLKGNAPSAGRLRVYFCNWPRSGRTIHYRSDGMYLVDPGNSGVDLDLPVRGRFIDLPYFVSDTNVWALWAQIEYFPFRGEKFVTVTYSGMRVPQIVPPEKYRPTSVGASQITAVQGRQYENPFKNLVSTIGWSGSRQLLH